MTAKLNTNYMFEFEDGTTAALTLTFYKLYQLKTKNKALYDRYNTIMGNSGKGKYDELETLEILYIAYLCANLDEENVMTNEEFMIKCGCDRFAVADAFKALTQPKKQ